MAVYSEFTDSSRPSRQMLRQSICSGGMPRYLTRLSHLPELPPAERDRLQPVTERFAFRANEYYSSLINWEDPNDPIRKIIVPEVTELADSGLLDASHEHLHKVAPGLEHKYGDTAVMLVNDVCGGFCRFCFRKRLFMHGNDEVTHDFKPALEYISNHPEISNVLLSGGDPLLMATEKLDSIITRLRRIEHVRIIRIGTKMPAFNPYRILQDSTLEQMLREHTEADRKIYLMTHFNHPRELTVEAIAALDLLQGAGAILMNQTPVLKGINNDPTVLGDLFNTLSYAGVHPYYVFQCRPTAGNRHFALPVEHAYRIYEKARNRCSGLAKRARFIMSHATGKVEVVGRTRDQVFMRYHRAADAADRGTFMIFRSNPDAYWFDDYLEAEAREERLDLRRTA